MPNESAAPDPDGNGNGNGDGTVDKVLFLHRPAPMNLIIFADLRTGGHVGYTSA